MSTTKGRKVASKNPLGKAAETAIRSIRHPGSTASKVVEQAKGTVALGKMVTGHVGKAAASMAAETASSVLGKATGRKPAERPVATPPASPQAPRAESPTTLRSVPDVNEPGHTLAENKGSGPVKAHGDPLTDRTPAAKPAEEPVAKKAARKAPGKKAPAKSTPTQKRPAKKAAGKKTPTKKTPAKKAAAKKAAAKTVASESATLRKAAERNPE